MDETVDLRAAEYVAAAETLALIAEHRLTILPVDTGSGWIVGLGRLVEPSGALVFDDAAMGPTIGEAVRACVARIRS